MPAKGDTMNVASIQMAVVEGDKAATIEKACSGIRRCKGADLIVLPEIWNVGFMSFDRYHSEAEDREGPTLTAMQSMAREVKAYLHTGSFVESDDGRYYNASYLLSPEGEILAGYRKIHLFGYNSRETQLLTPGDAVQVVKTPLATFGMATCFDLRFPELFRRMVEAGAEVFLVCSAWPYPRLEPWLMLNRVRALENQCYLIASNAVGINQGVQLVGHSMVVDPWGTVLAGGGDQEIILRAEIDCAEVHAAREEFPGLAGRVEWLNRPPA
jgi:predicted amidohydrolase